MPRTEHLMPPSPSSVRQFIEDTSIEAGGYWMILPVETRAFSLLSSQLPNGYTVQDIAKVYTDGGVISKNPSDIGGTWAVRFVDKDDNVVHEMSGIVFPNTFGMTHITNNFTEFYAMLMAFEYLPEHWIGDVYCDSEITLGRWFYGWKLAGIPMDIIKRFVDIRKKRTARNITLLAGHPSMSDLARGYKLKTSSSHAIDAYPVAFPVSEHNKWCDKTCEHLSVDYVGNIQLIITGEAPKKPSKSRKIRV